jgi:hypothetical protein
MQPATSISLLEEIVVTQTSGRQLPLNRPQLKLLFTRESSMYTYLNTSDLTNLWNGFPAQSLGQMLEGRVCMPRRMMITRRRTRRTRVVIAKPSLGDDVEYLSIYLIKHMKYLFLLFYLIYRTSTVPFLVRATYPLYGL